MEQSVAYLGCVVSFAPAGRKKPPVSIFRAVMSTGTSIRMAG